jgi:hypothetical protein
MLKGMCNTKGKKKHEDISIIFEGISKTEATGILLVSK